MPDFDNNGARIHYELVGSGPPLLLVAGLASDGASWGPLTPLLAQRFRLILLDNRGSGRTKADGALSIDDMADDAAALLGHLKIAGADVAGHSLGGYIGLVLAVRHPARVNRIVTLATAALGPKGLALLDDMARLYFTIPPGDWFRLLYQWLFSAPFFADPANVAAAAEASAAYPWRQSPGDFARQVAAIKTAGPTDLARVACPVLAISAERDLLASAPGVDAAHATIPGMRRLHIPGAAHSIHWEATDAVAEAVLGFLR